MIIHYLKVAVRNLLRYKTQSVVSLLGLAIGFACVSLAVYWTRYEVTYDAFQKNADRIYRVRVINPYTKKVLPSVPEPLAAYLKEHYPEVENACAMYALWVRKLFVDGEVVPLHSFPMQVTPETLDMFDIEWLEGNRNIGSWGEHEIAIAEQLARQIYGDKSPIGQKLTEDNGEEYEIVGVFKTWPKHSNFNFEILGRLRAGNEWSYGSSKTYVMLKKGVDHERFVQKMQTDTLNTTNGIFSVYEVWTPLKDLRYTHPEAKQNVRLEDVRLFNWAAILLAVCVVFNYLTLFVSRIRNRGRDMALRTVCGSTGWQMSGLLMTEYSLLLFGALFTSMLFVELVARPFMELAQIQVERSAVYLACGYLALFIVVLALLLSFLPIFYFKRKTLRVQIEAVKGKSNRGYFRMMSVCVQLIISMLFMFCATVMIKQVHYLIHSDINIERKQIAWISAPVGVERTMDILRTIPAVKEFIPVNEPLYPIGWSASHSRAEYWDGKAAGATPVAYRMEYVNNDIARFYGLVMKEGDDSFDLDSTEVIINETLAIALGMDNPVGKSLDGYIIKGVVKDFQNQTPTNPIEPLLFCEYGTHVDYVAFKYYGDFDTCEKILTEAFQKEENPECTIKDGEQTYRGYMKSEYNFLKLLSFVTVVSLLIALFGIYALIVQACEQRRKEIAIRKVNGAHVMDILTMFLKQYVAQVAVAAVIAFPIGYVLMRRWLEHYTRQTEMGIELFVAIFIIVAIMVVLCIGRRVWIAANENPATELKKE